MLHLSSDVNCRCLSYTKLEIVQLPREESAEKSNEIKYEDVFVSADGIDTAITCKKLAISFLDKTHVTKMKLNWIFPQSIAIGLLH